VCAESLSLGRGDAYNFLYTIGRTKADVAMEDLVYPDFFAFFPFLPFFAAFPVELVVLVVLVVLVALVDAGVAAVSGSPAGLTLCGFVPQVTF